MRRISQAFQIDTAGFLKRSLLLAAVFALGLTACSKKEEKVVVTPSGTPSTSAPAADGKVNLSIATGGTGGVYYPLGGGMANVLSKYVPGYTARRKSPADRSIT